jgi:hypothetical protein
MVQRSLNPTGPNGLTHVSTTSQSPYQSNLPHDLKATPLLEVAYDNDFDANPTGPTDGLPAGSNVSLEDITVQLTGVGVASISVANVAAVHTTTAPTGKSFDVAGIGTGTVQITVAAYGDVDFDLDVDLADYATFPGCMTGPDLGPETQPCDVFDFNQDDDVDLGDFASFQLGFTTP